MRHNNLLLHPLSLYTLISINYSILRPPVKTAFEPNGCYTLDVQKNTKSVG